MVVISAEGVTAGGKLDLIYHAETGEVEEVSFDAKEPAWEPEETTLTYVPTKGWCSL